VTITRTIRRAAAAGLALTGALAVSFGAAACTPTAGLPTVAGALHGQDSAAASQDAAVSQDPQPARETPEGGGQPDEATISAEDAEAGHPAVAHYLPDCPAGTYLLAGGGHHIGGAGIPLSYILCWLTKPDGDRIIVGP